MGFEVHVSVVMKQSPKEAVMTALDHQFEAVHHDRGSTTVTIEEHVSIADESDAIAFVRSLVTDAIPEGAKITSITATPD